MRGSYLVDLETVIHTIGNHTIKTNTQYNNTCHIPPSDVWFHKAQHVDSGLVEFDEHTIVDLPQTK